MRMCECADVRMAVRTAPSDGSNRQTAVRRVCLMGLTALSRLTQLPALILILSFLTNPTSAQDTCRLRISLITCTPGEELYSTFGHTALRVTDSVSNTDIIYNYGTFNFEEPGFYTKFIQGKLPYYLSTENPEIFMYDIAAQNRGITEQVLNLTCEEKKRVMALLAENMLPKNRTYRYDFFYDNCTTRCRDLIEKATGGNVKYPQIVKENTRFRELIHEYLDLGNMLWSKLGIDMLMGKKTDGIMTNNEAMFLPDYLMKSYDQTFVGNRKLVAENLILFKPASLPEKNNFSGPFFVLLLITILIILVGFSKNAAIQRILVGFDGFLFFLVGMSGLMMLFMWAGTEHVMCEDNFNLLWAWPTHAVMAFFLHNLSRQSASRKSFAKGYFKVSMISNIIILLAWFFLPQQLNPALLWILILMIWRSGKYITGK